MSATKRMIPDLPETVSAAALVGAVDRFAALPLGPRHPDIALVETFVPTVERIFLHSDEAPRRALLAAARRSPPLAEQLISRIFPAVALRLEEGWNTDRLSFVDVTIAAARVQDGMRALGRFVLPPVERPSLLLVVPEWEQHTLPGTFAADRLRRMGAPTRLVTGLSTAQLLPLIARTGPSGLLLSVASHSAAARLRPLIGALRGRVQRPIPIVVGGPAMTADSNVCRNSGADLATSDLSAALRFCNFDIGEGVDEISGADA